MSSKRMGQNIRSSRRSRRVSKRASLEQKILGASRLVRKQVRGWMTHLSNLYKSAFLKLKTFEDLVTRRVQILLVGLSVRHLHGPKKIAYGLDELIVVCVVRNGRPYIKSFIDHYLYLGVKHIVFLDNGSEDGTTDVAVAQGQERVSVIQTKLPFKKYEFVMKQYLISRFGKGRWSLYVDIDELFD